MGKLSIEQALQKGIEAHEAGNVQEADRYYSAILKAHPKHPDANHNMGVLAVGIGKVQAALPFYKTALEANPSIMQFWLSYIDALVKIDRITEAKVVFDQAKSHGVKGDAVDKLEKVLGTSAVHSNNPSQGQASDQTNVLDKLKLDQALKLAAKKVKEKASEDAKRIYQDILIKFPKNKKAIESLKKLSGKVSYSSKTSQDPSQAQLQALLNLHGQGQLKQALEQCKALFQQHPRSAILFNIQGALLKGLDHLDLSVEAYKKAISIKPDYAEAFSNMGNALKAQGKLEEALEAYNKAISIKPDYAEAYFNMGGVLKEQQKRHEELEAYNKAISIKPDFAEVYNNMGVTLQYQGKQEEAKEAYTKALSIKPDYAEAYNNMGNALRDQGKLEEASEAYKKALSIQPNNSYAHRNFSIITKYKLGDPHIRKIETLLQSSNLSDSDRCNLHYTNAKIQEDLENLGGAFDSYVDGGKLRKKLLKYEFSQDERLFAQVKTMAPQLNSIVANLPLEEISLTPIFILGMPRSGTTLVEQIVSSHSTVTGAGELRYIAQYGKKLALGQSTPNVKTLMKFRNQYFTELAKRSEGRSLITDKMPLNFIFIALICAAFPEAKIIHVNRDPKATCWSNFKHYFVSSELGYSYDLADIIKYYRLYVNLMQFWGQIYSNRIFNVNYDQLTENQEPEIRRLIANLGLSLEDACLAPENNSRAVKTASNIQIRQKIYKGSSDAWRKFEPFLAGVFEELDLSGSW